jgi:hypothetical protein
MGKGPHQAKAKKIYNELRDNLINNIYKVKKTIYMDTLLSVNFV